MSEGQSAGSQGQAAQSQQGGQGQGSGSQGTTNGQGSGTPEYVTKADYDALVSKLDDVISDNVRYRQERRQSSGNQGGNSSNNQNNQGSQNDATSKLSGEMETLRAELRVERFTNAITSAATAAGALNPSRIARLLDINDVADEKGNVRDAGKLIEKLKQSDPYLFGKVVQGGGDGGAGNGTNEGNQPTDMNAIMRREARRR